MTQESPKVANLQGSDFHIYSLKIEHALTATPGGAKT